MFMAGHFKVYYADKLSDFLHKENFECQFHSFRVSCKPVITDECLQGGKKPNCHDKTVYL